jgi:iron complex transport system permease protein
VTAAVGAALPAAVRFRRLRREAVATAVLVAALLLVAGVAVSVGAYTLGPAELLRALVGAGEPRDEFIVLQLRLPRVLTAIVVGAAFALGGALLQTLARNPLASPDVIGITQGASVGALGATLALGLSGIAVSAAAFVGALLVAALMAAFSARSGLGGYRFVLVGIGLAFLGQAVIGFLLTRADVRDAQSALVWLVGSVAGARWPELGVAALLLVLLLPLVAVAARRLRVLQLGDDAAAALGVRPASTRLLVLGVGAALAATATAAVGPVAFVAFVAAPLTRRALRTGGLALLPSAIVGSLLVVLADLIAQHLLPGELQVPVGVVTALIGAPYLLWLLARADRTRE